MDRELIEKIKAANDIVEIVGDRVALKKAGARFKGLSPFNNEKSPSFFVNPEMQRFHCFSTNQGGDVVKFVMLTRGMSFPEAVEWLAKRVNIRVEKRELSPEEKTQRTQQEQAERVLFKLNRFAAHYFQNQFLSEAGSVAREYAEKRGLTQKTLEAFAIGFAPDSWSGLRDYLQSIKAPLTDAVKLGLLRAKNEEEARADGANLYDFFRYRLIFPIRNVDGEVIGFGGRAMAAESDGVKYLNSPESLVYDKGRSLFNLDRARKFIREADTVILVEGYMDCIALDQAGIQNVVANLGTALTPQHVQILSKLASRVICLYDADTAGQRALERNMELFLEHGGIPLLGTQVPSGKDPDEFLRSAGPDATQILRKTIAEAPAWIDVWMDRQVQATPQSLQARTEALEKIAEKLSQLKEDLWIRARIPGLATALQFREDLVVDAIRRKRAGKNTVNAQSRPVVTPSLQKSEQQKPQQNKAQSDKKSLGFEWQFLQDLVRYPDWIPTLRDLVTKDPQSYPALAIPELAKATQFLLAPLAPGESEEVRLRRLFEELRDQAVLENFVSCAAMERGAESTDKKSLQDYLQNMRKQFAKRRQQELRAEIAAAEKIGDDARRQELQTELIKLVRATKLGDTE